VAWTATGGGDHGGADWIISADTSVAGLHTNVGKFEVQAGQIASVQLRVTGTDIGSSPVVDLSDATATVTDASADLQAAGCKWVELKDSAGKDICCGWAISTGVHTLTIFKDSDFIHRGWSFIGSGNSTDIASFKYLDTPANFDVRARDIFVEGTIDAIGVGHLGGAGGGGVYAGGCGGACNSCSGSASAGSNGSAGEGPFGGGVNGGHAGYLGASANGDATTSEYVTTGSGGGGGRAGNSCTPNCNAGCPTECACGTESGSNRCRGGSGGGNAHGGGAVMLVAANRISITGSISALGANSYPGGGGESDSCGTGGSGYASGRGAGGGILLKCKGTGGIAITGALDTRGGNSSTTAYGSTKIFALPGRIATTGATLNTGHDGAGGFGVPFTSETLAAPAYIF
jgi:hypothetical protein